MALILRKPMTVGSAIASAATSDSGRPQAQRDLVFPSTPSTDMAGFYGVARFATTRVYLSPPPVFPGGGSGGARWTRQSRPPTPALPRKYRRREKEGAIHDASR